MAKDRRGAWALLLVAALALLSSAWLDDDAFITLRTIDNLLDGRGPVWNTAERVQAYTHPLWLALNAGLIALTGAPELTCVSISMALSLATLCLLIFRVASSLRWGCVCGLALLLSKSFVDFSTSGLEDPLTRLLLVLFALVLLRPGAGSAREHRLLVLLAALVTLCRPDAILIVLPALVLRFERRAWRRHLGAAIAGFLPLALWAAFSLFYYGSPFPNTAYAKLGAGVPRLGAIVQGGSYLLESMVRDPATLTLLGVSLVLVLRDGHRRARSLALGAPLYLAYVVWIGGGYMSGRFLGLPLLAAVAAAAMLPAPALDRRTWTRAAIAGSLLLVPRLIEPLVQDGVGIFGIGDERRTHHPYTGLIYALGPGRWPEHSLRSAGEALEPGAVRPEVAIGMVGFYADPSVHLVDVYGLSDPLLARLPGRIGSTINRPHRIGWRPGHVRRPLPEGYVESLPSNANRIADPDLAAFYDVLRLVTREPLFAPGRLRAIVALNLGAHQHLVESYVARHPDLFRAR